MIEIRAGRWMLVPLSLALLAIGCDWPWEQPTTSTIVQQTQTVTIGSQPSPSPSASPSAAPAGFCATPSQPVAALRFGVRDGSCAVQATKGCAVLSLGAGEVATLDISPLDAAGQPVVCHGTLTVSAGPAAQVTLKSGGGTDFLPQVLGGMPGTARLDAEVNGTTGFLEIHVQ